MMSRSRLCFIYIVTFVVMHGTGVLVKTLPYIVNASITVSVVLFTLVLLEIWYTNTSAFEAFRQLGFRGTGMKGLIPSAAIGLLIVSFYPAFGRLANTDVYLTVDWLPNLIGLSLTAGLAEEAFFRGFVFGHLREKMTFRKAALESMILFSLTHLPMFFYLDWTIALFSTFLAIGSAIPLAYLFERGNQTIWGPALVHTIIRTIGMVVSTSGEVWNSMVLCWIIACLGIPYTVLAFYTDFRSTWKSNSL